MIYTIGFMTLSFMIFFAWLWRYYIKPYFAKNALNAYFKNHKNGQQLKQANQLLKKLYRHTPSAIISYRERKKLNIQDDAFTYGEIEFLSFFSILDIIAPKSHEIFYDLGAGSGKALFAVAFYGDIEKCYGIELLKPLYQLAKNKINMLAPEYPTETARIQLINNDFLQHDFTDGDIIFINATCLSYSSWEKIQEKLLSLKSGSRIIVTTKKIQHELFELIHHGMTLMSWGMNSINIYKKK